MPDRNDPCPCGSGKKYKKCCGSPAATSAGSAPAARPDARPPGPLRPPPPSDTLVEARRARHLKERVRTDGLHGSLFYNSGSHFRGS